MITATTNRSSLAVLPPLAAGRHYLDVVLLDYFLLIGDRYRTARARFAFASIGQPAQGSLFAGLLHFLSSAQLSYTVPPEYASDLNMRARYTHLTVSAQLESPAGRVAGRRG